MVKWLKEKINIDRGGLLLSFLISVASAFCIGFFIAPPMGPREGGQDTCESYQSLGRAEGGMAAINLTLWITEECPTDQELDSAVAEYCAYLRMETEP